MIKWFDNLKKELFLLGIVSIVTGIVMILYPDTVSKVMCYVIGGVLIITGAFSLLAILTKKGAKPFSFRVIPAALAVAVGFLFVFGAGFVFEIIWVFAGVGIIMNSYFKNAYAYELKYSGNDKWWINLVLSMISLAMGIILIVKPFEVQKTMIIFTGLFLAIDGVCDLVSTFVYIGEYQRIKHLERKEAKEKAMQEKLTAKEMKLAKKLAKKKNNKEVINIPEVVMESKEAATIDEKTENDDSVTVSEEEKAE